MAFWSKWFGSDRAKVPEEELEALAKSAAILVQANRATEGKNGEGSESIVDRGAISYNSFVCAVEPCFSALERYPLDDAVLRVVARALTFSGDPDTAEACLRAADAPHDVRVWFELGARLLAMERPGPAISMLTHALSLSPFNPVVRSELAIAETRAGRPGDAVATLALHPNLVSDPGALFTFGWASLLGGDLASANSALRELTRKSRGSRNRGPLVEKLDAAVRRARSLAVRDDEQIDLKSARDFLFLEHGCLLLEQNEQFGGRFLEPELDSARVGRLLGGIGWAATELLGEVGTVCAVDETSEPYARALSLSLGSRHEKLGTLLPPSGLVIASDAVALARAEARLRLGNRSLLTATLWMDWTRPEALVPDLVGLFCDTASVLDHDVSTAAVEEPPFVVREFVRSKREYLPPHGRRVRSAYVPDAPLPGLRS